MLAEIETISGLVHEQMDPTPLYQWPLLDRRAGCEVWVKHENYGPTGAVAARGAIVYLHQVRQRMPEVLSVATASLGNHGLAVAFAARRVGLDAVVVMPEASEARKIAAIEAMGGEVVCAGDDLDESLVHAQRLAKERGIHLVPSFHPWLVQGAASCALELFRGSPALDVLYVPIGKGTVISAMIVVRDMLELPTRIVGVTALNAPAYADSFWAEHVMTRPTANTIASGLACRVPEQMVVDIMVAGADKVASISDEDIVAAAGYCFRDTRNLIEGAAAATLAAVLADKEHLANRRVGLLLSGGNVEDALAREVLALPNC